MLLALALPALAQDGGFDAHGFRFASGDADLRDPVTFLRPGAQSALDTSLGVAAEYARRPLVFEPQPGERQVLLEDLVALNLAGGFAVAAPLRIGVEAPVVLTSSNPFAGRVPQPAVLGDVRATAMLLPLRPDGGKGAGIGLVGHVGLPTGPAEWYLGEGGISGGGALVGTWESPRVTLSGRVGGRFTPGQPADVAAVATRGTSVEGALALSVLPGGDFAIGAEAHGAVAVDGTVREALGIPAEVLLTGKWAHPTAGAFVLMGVGAGVGLGAGASPVRAVLATGWGLEAGRGADTDGDGFVDRVDGCPESAESVNGYVDGDGCPDALPRIEVVAGVDGPEAEQVRFSVTRPEGRVEQGVGSLELQAVPGQTLRVAARLGPCRLGSAVVEVSEVPDQRVEVPLDRVTTSVFVLAQDGAGRRLPAATVKYIVDDPVCGPASDGLEGGQGRHEVGVGEHTVMITAPGFDIHQDVITLEPGQEASVVGVLSPTQVQVVDGVLELLTGPLFEPGSATLSAEAPALVSQMATVILVDGLRVRVTGHPDEGSGRQLAWDRAKALKAALEAEGVPPAQLEMQGATGPSASQVTVKALP